MLGHSAIAAEPVGASSLAEEEEVRQPLPVRGDFTAGHVIRAAPIPRVFSVSVSPSTAAGSAQFVAAATAENGASTAITWEKDGAGTLSTSGYFTEPAKTGQVQTIVIRARSVFDPSVFGSAIVTIAAEVVALPIITGVIVSPESLTLNAGATVQLFATVTGQNNPPQTVVWSTTIGQITQSGVLTAPTATEQDQVGFVTARSTEDENMSAMSTITVLANVDEEPTNGFTPSKSRTVKILPGQGQRAFEVGSFWTMTNAGPVGSKDPQSTIDIPFDWAPWLADFGATKLGSVTFIMGGGLEAGDVVLWPTGAAVMVSGGAGGNNANGTVTCRIVSATDPTRTDDRTVVLQIRDQ